MNPQEELDLLNKLLDELVSGIQDMLQSGEVLSDEFQGLLAQEIGSAMDRITSLQEEMQLTRPQASVDEPVPTGADLLWILAGGNQDAFVNYLRTYPDSGLNGLLRNPTQLAQIIEQLERTMPQGQAETQKDGVQKAPLESSNVYGYKYDPKSGKLLVRFQSGSVYKYDGIPPGIFQVFQQGAVPAKTTGKNKYGQWWTGKIPSLGAAFYNLIRQGGYPYQRLN